MKITTAFAFVSLALSCASAAYADTFGSLGNTFDIEFVMIGNPGNVADMTGNPASPHPTGSVREPSSFGFRVASIPEPSTSLLGALASVGLLVWRLAA